MPIIRNPFRKNPVDQCTEDTAFPISPTQARSSSYAEAYPSVSKPLSIRSNQEPKPTEYKLSEINDSGVFVPPSPPETKSSFWSSRSATSTRSSSHRSVFNENEPFNISRESFESYRRSFDISARSPVLESGYQRPRGSLDARQMRLPSSHSLTSSPKHLQMTSSVGPPSSEFSPDFQPRRPSITPYHPRHFIRLTDKHVNPPTCEPEEPEDAQRPVPEEEEEEDETEGQDSSKISQGEAGLVDRFEDVGLGDDSVNSKPWRRPQHTTAQNQLPPANIQAAKKPGIFSRFTNSSSSADTPATAAGHVEGSNGRPGSSGIGLGLGSSSHGFFGRKRGGSGQGAELGSVHAKRLSVGASPVSQEVKTEG